MKAEMTEQCQEAIKSVGIIRNSSCMGTLSKSHNCSYVCISVQYPREQTCLMMTHREKVMRTAITHMKGRVGQWWYNYRLHAIPLQCPESTDDSLITAGSSTGSSDPPTSQPLSLLLISPKCERFDIPSL